VDCGRAAKALRVGCERIEERGWEVGVEMELNGGVVESEERKMTVLAMRVTAWGFGWDGELPMP
jgi:hypothetical protein